MAYVEYGSVTADHSTIFGYPSGVTSSVNCGIPARSKVNGEVTEVRMRTMVASINPMTFRSWRDISPDSLDCRTLVDSSVYSGDIADNTWITLSEPLTIRAGDAIGVAYTSNGGLSVASTGTTTSVRFQNSNKTDNAAWTSSNTYAMRMEFNGVFPRIITYGDSISTGYGGWVGSLSSFGAGFYTAPNNLQAWDYSWIIASAMGLRSSISSGEPAAQIDWGLTNYATRVAPYAESGSKVIANWGVNDIIIGGRSYAAHEADWDTLLGYVRADGMRLIRQEILYVKDGYTSGGHDAAYWNAIIDTWNGSMASWCGANGVWNIRVNNDWIADWIGADNVHPGLTGYQSIGAIMARKIKAKQRKKIGLLMPI